MRCIIYKKNKRTHFLRKLTINQTHLSDIVILSTKTKETEDTESTDEASDDKTDKSEASDSNGDGQAPDDAGQTQEITLDDIKEGDVAAITLDDDGNAATITVQSMEMGGGQGGPGSQASGVDSYDAANEYSSDETVSDTSLESTGTDENAALVSNGAEVTFNNDAISRTSSDSQGGDNSSFYGVGAAVLATDGTAYVKDSTVTTDSKGGAGEALSMGTYGWFFEEFMCKQGLEYVDNGNGREAAAEKVVFDENGGALNILNEWKKLYDAGYAPNVGRGGDSGLADFSSGKAAITLGSTASLKQILQDVNGSFEVGTAYFPSITDDDKGGVSIGGASLWMLDNQDDAKKAATWEFVKYLVSAESQAYWNAQTGYFPVTTAAHDEQVFKDNIAEYPQFQTAIDQLHDSAPEYAGALLSVFPEARSIVETEIENMLNGKQSAEDAVSKMASDMNKSIEDYNLLNE